MSILEKIALFYLKNTKSLGGLAMLAGKITGRRYNASAALREEKKRVGKLSLLNNNPFILDFSQTDLRPCYDSTWKIQTVDGDEYIVRWDDDSTLKMCKLLSSVRSLSELRNLDMREKIFYD